ncbi:MAG: serine/threonine-protein kinase [Myxococcota bacterium]
MGDMVTDKPTLYCSSCLTTFVSDEELCPNLSCALHRPPNGWGQMYEPGDVIDRNYKVTKRLALGGAGVTYLVRALDDDGDASGPEIALKLLFATRDHGAYLRRLSTEAQILQELDHPNIVQYLGFVHRTGQSPYLLTRFEAGGSFLDHMRRVGTLSVREAAAVGRQVCWALEKGHAQGIIHRDLKPENLLLKDIVLAGETPEVRVADFGIARVVGSIGAGLTRAGAFVGTPQYAAPEQFLGQVASDKADVYSLGAVLVFLMTARPVIKKAHVMASEDVYTQLLDALPPSINRPDDSEKDCARMNQILAHMMHIDPDERCTVVQLDEMLRLMLEDQEVEVSNADFESSVTFDAPISSDFVRVQTGELSETISDRGGVAQADMKTHVPSASGDSPTPPVERSSGTWSNRATIMAGIIGPLMVICGLYVFMPWHIDTLPLVGVEYVDGGSSGEKGVAARTAVAHAIRVRKESLRAKCDLGKAQWFQMEFGVDKTGTILWARPETSTPGSGCISRALRWEQTNTTLKGPVRVELKFNL